MNSALAIASMTSVLKSLLDNRLIQSGVTASVGEVTVTALPPDRITTGSDERSQINLFLYRVTPHTTWRGARIGIGEEHQETAAPSLAFDLHYLITAYGERDFQAEILLGYAMQLLMETPVLTSETIQNALATSAAGVMESAFSAFTFDDQETEITLSPEFLTTEEASKLWSALQAKYRLSAAYQVSAVIVAAER
ncbi:MAG: DUF4255 domain-containing protein [Thermomicrobiales bacterium]